jgi:hypothetical protein
MFGSEMLEIAIGLSLVYLLLSSVCTAAREGIEVWMKTRAVVLERGIRELLHDQDGTGLAKTLYNHPLIYSLFQGEYDPAEIKANGLMRAGTNLPSYIPAGNFAVALLDIVARGPQSTSGEAAKPAAASISLAGIRGSIERIDNPPVQRALLSAIDVAQGDLARVQANIEAWYNSTMDRVSGWYKRRTQIIVFFLSIGVTVGVNANTIIIAQHLAQDSAVREAIVQEVKVIARDRESRDVDIKERLAALDRLGLPIGWAEGWPGPRSAKPADCGRWCWIWYNALLPTVGWLITALAVSLGAPFWFDVLNKFMVIRSTVKPHEKSPEEASEDHQQKPVAFSRTMREEPAKRPESPTRAVEQPGEHE